ncbi:MAG: hypothetical protein JSV79_00280 [Armatimonadota bacterium]|nr:MAG: hypothetical protein JSV79_00280 [Armatimonadota bacterium]
MKITVGARVVGAVLALLGCLGRPVGAAEARGGEAGTGGPAGVVRSGKFVGPISGREVRYNIYLPPGYEEGEERYPVSYFLHGVNGNESSHNEIMVPAIEEAVAAGIIKPMIVVFPNGCEDVYWGDSKDGSKPAETTIIRELIPHVDKTYRTIPDRRHRVIQGFSMGGYGAVEYAVKFPELFSICVSYDGALHTWRTLSALRPSVTEGLYGNDEAYFNDYSPWVQVRRNARRVRNGVAIRLVVGVVGDLNQRYGRALRELDIPVDYVETGCAHDLTCIMNAAGRNSFKFIAEHLGKSGR